MKKLIFLIVTGLLHNMSSSQDTLQVLFLGNSYTAVNNLPSLVQQCASSVGKVIQVSSNTPGGYTFAQHVTNSTSMSLIQQGDWDFVVLQEQSQMPSFPISQVETQCFPYAAQLNDSIDKYSRCGETIFYQTWGRQNGDASNCPNWPPVCTYEGMDSLLRLRYQMMADDNEALVSPVGACWRYIRVHYPAFNLYNADQSHPALFGSYVGALCFYTTLYRESSDAVTFTAGLSTEEVSIAKEAVNAVVFDNLMEWNIGDFDFEVNTVLDTVGFSIVVESDCIDCDSIHWFVGDGSEYDVPSFTHTYSQPGMYGITMVAYQCGEYDSQYWEAYIENTVGITTNEVEEISYKRIGKNEIKVNINGSIGTHFELIDVKGKKVSDFEVRGNEGMIVLSDLSAGIYMLVPEKNGSKAYKFQY